MEAESHNWSHFLNQNWRFGNLECQSVHQDMMFFASSSLHNLGGQKWPCPCYHARHLHQSHWSKLLCGIYGQIVCSSVRLPCLLLIRCILSKFFLKVFVLFSMIFSISWRKFHNWVHIDLKVEIQNLLILLFLIILLQTSVFMHLAGLD